MTVATAVIELLVPGLFGPLPAPPERRPVTPTLDLLLARAETVSGLGDDAAAALCARFDAAASAPYALAADDPTRERAGFWLHADPVHLRPDRDRLRLFDARHLGITRAEADALVAELNAHFAADGLQVIAPSASRWYLMADDAPRLATQPLERVIGRSVDGALPEGPDAGRWASLMNEAQMLLFQSPVNRRREQEGRPAVNGLWTWGGGQWQGLAADKAPVRVLASDPLARGLAEAAGASAGPIGEPPAPETGATLVHWQALQACVLDSDESAWAGAAEQFDRWLAPLSAHLRAGRLAALVLDPCDGSARRITRRALRRFWRRPAPFVQRLDTG
jgi:hypothetical protein